MRAPIGAIATTLALLGCGGARPRAALEDTAPEERWSGYATSEDCAAEGVSSRLHTAIRFARLAFPEAEEAFVSLDLSGTALANPAELEAVGAIETVRAIISLELDQDGRRSARALRSDPNDETIHDALAFLRGVDVDREHTRHAAIWIAEEHLATLDHDWPATSERCVERGETSAPEVDAAQAVVQAGVTSGEAVRGLVQVFQAMIQRARLVNASVD